MLSLEHPPTTNPLDSLPTCARVQEEQLTKCKSYLGDCHQHLRNIIINGMTLKATEVLKLKLEDDLAELSPFERTSVDGMDLIRAIFKELHGCGEYAKGKGREFEAWRKLNYPSALWLPFERAMGSRMDLAFDGCEPIFWNRKIILELLNHLLMPGADNKLETFLWRALSSTRCTTAFVTYSKGQVLAGGVYSVHTRISETGICLGSVLPMCMQGRGVGGCRSLSAVWHPPGTLGCAAITASRGARCAPRRCEFNPLFMRFLPKGEPMSSREHSNRGDSSPKRGNQSFL